MKITTVMFDLDGTLLPMDQDHFVEYYFGLLAKKLAPYGYEPSQLIKAIWAGTAAMVKNDGAGTNEEAFWRIFAGVFGESVYEQKPFFEDFYRVEFQQARAACGFNEAAAPAVREIKKLGLRTVLATNPIFPAVAVESRLRWAGLEPEDFELYTSYEKCHFCKPNTAYYQEILEWIGERPENCLMVGNDTAEDMIAETLGMKTFLMPDCLINKENRDIDRYPHGGFPELLTCVKTLV